MSQMASKFTYLPIELVLNVITQSLPVELNAILPPSHPTTQTLLAFTLVCHETRKLAQRLLLRHCVYLSSEHRLRVFVGRLSKDADTRNISSLFLAPYGMTVHDLSAAKLIRDLFDYTAPTLKRLILDIPLREFDHWDDSLGILKILTHSFLMLTNLEEFVSVQDQLDLGYMASGDDQHCSITHGVIWSHWPKLKRLALYNPMMTDDFYRDVDKLPALETLVLTRALGGIDNHTKGPVSRRVRRPLKMVLVNVERRQLRLEELRGRESWCIVDPQKLMTVFLYNAPNPYHTLELNRRTMEKWRRVCRAHVKERAEAGTIWDWEGEELPHLDLAETASA